MPPSQQNLTWLAIPFRSFPPNTTVIRTHVFLPSLRGRWFVCTYIYIYIYVCVCVCESVQNWFRSYRCRKVCFFKSKNYSVQVVSRGTDCRQDRQRPSWEISTEQAYCSSNYPLLFSPKLYHRFLYCLFLILCNIIFSFLLSKPKFCTYKT